MQTPGGASGVRAVPVRAPALPAVRLNLLQTLLISLYGGGTKGVKNTLAGVRGRDFAGMRGRETSPVHHESPRQLC
jgi:hypothetical protein